MREKNHSTQNIKDVVSNIIVNNKEILNTHYQLNELELDSIQADINGLNSQAKAITELSCNSLKQECDNQKKVGEEWRQLYIDSLNDRNRILKQISNERNDLCETITKQNAEIERLQIDKIVLQDELNENSKKKRWWR